MVLAALVSRLLSSEPSKDPVWSFIYPKACAAIQGATSTVVCNQVDLNRASEDAGCLAPAYTNKYPQLMKSSFHPSPLFLGKDTAEQYSLLYQVEWDSSLSACSFESVMHCNARTDFGRSGCIKGRRGDGRMHIEENTAFSYGAADDLHPPLSRTNASLVGCTPLHSFFSWSLQYPYISPPSRHVCRCLK